MTEFMENSASGSDGEEEYRTPADTSEGGISEVGSRALGDSIGLTLELESIDNLNSAALDALDALRCASMGWEDAVQLRLFCRSDLTECAASRLREWNAAMGALAPVPELLPVTSFIGKRRVVAVLEALALR